MSGCRKVHMSNLTAWGLLWTAWVPNLARLQLSKHGHLSLVTDKLGRMIKVWINFQHFKIVIFYRKILISSFPWKIRISDNTGPGSVWLAGARELWPSLMGYIFASSPQSSNVLQRGHHGGPACDPEVHNRTCTTTGLLCGPPTSQKNHHPDTFPLVAIGSLPFRSSKAWDLPSIIYNWTATSVNKTNNSRVLETI